MIKQILRWLDSNLLRILIGFLIAFIPLWPKKPLFDVPHTWVYIRLEDVFIALTFFWGLTLLIRKKFSLRSPLTLPIFLYWIAGGVSLIFTLLFTAKHMANFFPNVAIMHYLRRIEYIGVFFLALNSVTSLKDLKRYLYILFITIIGVVFYGFGQKLLGFPAFLTMNEEFAKGLPLYLAPTSRLTSTFAGHYDLAAYLVLVIAILTGAIFAFRNILGKIIIFILGFFALILLLLTASRISFGVYLITMTITLWWLKKKKFILPVIIGSIVLMTLVSGASERFFKTIRVRQVVYDATTGKAIGTLEEPPKNSVKKQDKVYVPITTETQENLPVGSQFINLPPAFDTEEEATTIATIKKPVAKSLKMSTVSAEIATISGQFLIRNALVYDISFTTRLQGEWPRAIAAFKSNPLLGTGFSSITLSNDNDYLRLLGETGLLGTISFLLIFFYLGVFIKNSLSSAGKNIQPLVLGFIGGVFGLAVNALFIDVFEASKVAFSLWILAGIMVSVLKLNFNKSINYLEAGKRLLTSNLSVLILLFTLSLIIFKSALSIYFVGDDFTWLKWAASSNLNDIPRNFISVSGFFYRPLAKIYYFILYNVFWLQPEGYNFTNLLFHLFCSFLVYLISFKFLSKKWLSLLVSFFFLILAIHGESVYWKAASVELIAPLFALLSFYLYCESKKILAFLAFIPALMGHEGIIIYPLIILAYDFFIVRKTRLKNYISYAIYIFIYLLIRFYSGAHWFNGDYSVNFKNLPFNFFGNLLAYIGGIVGGPYVREYFYNLRLIFKTALPLTSLIILIFAIFIFILFQKYRKWNSPDKKYFSFTIFAILISLLPYLGLGNTSERYVYFASFWTLLLIAFLIKIIFENRRLILVKSIILSLFIIIAGLMNLSELKKTEKDWQKAGLITSSSLLVLRQNFINIPPKSIFYIHNIPIRYQRAWVFPVGFDNGVWLAFKDKKIKVIKIKTVSEGLELQKNNPNSYVLTFDYYEIKEIKEIEVQIKINPKK